MGSMLKPSGRHPTESRSAIVAIGQLQICGKAFSISIARHDARRKSKCDDRREMLVQDSPGQRHADFGQA